jgi:dimeric dUTPase (all-alpha-NTP-PPase superfamily)
MMHRINRDLGFFYLQKKERVVKLSAACEEEFVKKIHFVFSLAMIASFKKHKWSRSTTRCIEDQGLWGFGSLAHATRVWKPWVIFFTSTNGTLPLIACNNP